MSSTNKQTVRFDFPHKSNLVHRSSAPSPEHPPSKPPHEKPPQYLDAVRPAYSGTKRHYDPDWELRYCKPPIGLGLHVPTLSTFLVHCFFFNPDYAHNLLTYFNRSARVTPPLVITRPVVRHRRGIIHFEPQRSDPYCTCSCCHYSCPTHSL